MIIVYTGNGKGKTTAGLGLGFRASGYKKKVVVVQFMKGRKTGEIIAQKKIPNFVIKQFGRKGFVDLKNPSDRDKLLAKKGFDYVKKLIESRKTDIVVLDEINIAIHYNLISLKDVIRLVKKVPKKMVVVLTGRYASKELIKIADIVTEMKEIKHHFRKGVNAVKGVDF